ncbi:stage III sporulation protein AE [Syntrophobotulus glycolicus DSM 8271]|uniref:Stage III sporulation protein AE n=1 Tax=Syntrophobotulus glycolicus (strain DSM 8271 / FlGlyR) TaxID=645991 RepID=F0T0S0_SYNGF|nr:stage III sporulation protein AE [Syntrophobotulus glycolicus]ADY56209.1 stage III sporulation protein AE [Syntrophobotulus glycolicus DSM 8271]
MKKEYWLGIVIMFILAFWAIPVLAETTETVDLAEEIDLSQFKGFLDQVDRDTQQTLPSLSLSNIFEGLKSGSIELSVQDILQQIFSAAIKEFLKNIPLVSKLLVLAILCAVINQLQTTFTGEVSKLSKLLTYFVLAGMALVSFQSAISIGISAIDRMVSFMQAVLPVMYTILLAMGNITSGALFKPLVMGSLVFLATIVKSIVLPLFLVSAVLRVFNHISGQFKLSKLAGLLEFGGKTAIGFIMTVFLGVMTIQGATGGVADSVTLRTAKYSADLVPVVGKYFKDAVELVASSGLILKSAVGIIALLAIILYTLSPIIQIIAMIITFKLSAALVEPLGEQELAESLQDIAKGLLQICITVAAVSVMFFITLSIIIGVGDLTVMLR